MLLLDNLRNFSELLAVQVVRKRYTILKFCEGIYDFAISSLSITGKVFRPIAICRLSIHNICALRDSTFQAVLSQRRNACCTS